MPPACALFILALNDEVLRPGLINEIGIWTLERACRDWNTLKKYTHFAQPFFNVNLSLSQLNSESLVSEVQGILKSQNINPAEQKLELTESVMIEQHENALKVMQALTGVGCTLALDDYGAGHSGLTNLQRYPFNAVKIDRAFVNLVLVSTQSQEIVRSSILLSHSLGMKVVAEGIETEGV